MKKVGLSFLITWMIASLAVFSVTAQMPAPTSDAAVPLQTQIHQSFTDHIQTDILVVLAIIGLRSRRLRRVRC